MKRHILLYLLCIGFFLTASVSCRADDVANTAKTLSGHADQITYSSSELLSNADKMAGELANGAVSNASVESLAQNAGDIANQAADIAGTATTLANGAIDSAIAAATDAVTSATDYVVNTATGIINDALGLSGDAQSLAQDALSFINGGDINPQNLLSGAADISKLTGSLTSGIGNLTSSSALSSLTGGASLTGGGAVTSALSAAVPAGLAANIPGFGGTADGVTAIGPVIAPGAAQQNSGPPCTPGLPCIQPKTPNDPLNPADGANAGGNNALKSGSAACDADFMNQVYARAWLESDREMKSGQIAIRKSDSVMEYSCFDQIVSIVAHKIGPIFSESPDFQNRQFAHSSLGTGAYSVYMGNDSLDKALENMVLSPLKNYQKNNFSHALLGGTGSASNTFTGRIGADSYNCDLMNRVHFAARCSNFGDDNPFLTFDELTTTDPRKHPSACNTPADAAKADLAANKDFYFVNFDLFKDYQTLQKAGVCAPGIPTGVNVIRYEVGRDFETAPPRTSETYSDRVCPNPGCYFDRESKKCTY